MATYLTSLGPFIRLGVVGCGGVGRTICFAIDSGRVHADLSAISDTNADRVQNLILELKRPTRSMSLPGLVASVDLVIEATNRHIAPVVIMAALNGGKDVLVTNTAAILAREDFARLAHERGLTIFAANTLLTEANALNTAAAAPGARVTLTIACPPPVLADAPFLRGRTLKAGQEPRVVFQGEAGDAMAAFPMLANIVAAASIGAGGADLLVRVRAHEVADATEIELKVAMEKQQTEARARVPCAGSEPVESEVIGELVVGFLRSLVSSIRLA
jgi:aspartate dehydrogenase